MVKQHGYGLIPCVFGPDEVSTIQEELSRTSLARTRAGVRHAMSSTCVARIAQDSRMLQLARSVLGEGAIGFRATIFEKTPEANWLVAWHQDTALPLRQRREVPGWGPWSVKEGVIYAHAPAQALEKVLALRVQLHDSTVENGPLRVLAGTHTHGVLTDEEIHVIAKDGTGVECVMAVGGVVAMRPLVIHASSKSQTEKLRRVLHIEYAESLEIDNGLELATV
jgi:ectoine hydroxylase-related dioxygenase (phytanoyl-CoA dioxygenase family)